MVINDNEKESVVEKYGDINLMQLMTPNHKLWTTFVQTLSVQARNFPDENEIRSAILHCLGFDEESISASLQYLSQYYPILNTKMLKDIV
jgi:hypothetical protein